MYVQSYTKPHGCVTAQGYARLYNLQSYAKSKNKTVLKYQERKTYVNQKKKVTKKCQHEMKEIHNTTPLLSLKTLTLSRATREMAVSRSTTGTGIESDDECGHVMSHASRRDRGGSVDNDWGNNRQRNIIMVGVRDSYSWRSLRRGMSSSLSRGRA